MLSEERRIYLVISSVDKNLIKDLEETRNEGDVPAGKGNELDAHRQTNIHHKLTWKPSSSSLSQTPTFPACGTGQIQCRSLVVWGYVQFGKATPKKERAYSQLYDWNQEGKHDRTNLLIHLTSTLSLSSLPVVFWQRFERLRGRPVTLIHAHIVVLFVVGRKRSLSLALRRRFLDSTFRFRRSFRSLGFRSGFLWSDMTTRRQTRSWISVLCLRIYMRCGGPRRPTNMTRRFPLPAIARENLLLSWLEEQTRRSRRRLPLERPHPQNRSSWQRRVSWKCWRWR